VSETRLNSFLLENGARPVPRSQRVNSRENIGNDGGYQKCEHAAGGDRPGSGAVLFHRRAVSVKVSLINKDAIRPTSMNPTRGDNAKR